MEFTGGVRGEGQEGDNTPGEGDEGEGDNTSVEGEGREGARLS